MFAGLRLVVRQFWCGFEHGHTTELAMERGRQFLRCVSCGWESDGVQCRDGSRITRFYLRMRAARERKAVA